MRGPYWGILAQGRGSTREVRTKTTEGQYSPVRLEQARLVSSLLYGTRSKLVYLKKCTSGHLNSKGFRREVFLMTRATQKELNKLRYHEVNMKTNLVNVYMFIEKTSRTICSGI